MGSEAVVTASVLVTVMLRTAVAVFAPESVTFAVKLEVPAVVGVPVIAPAALSVSPEGSAPLFRDQE